MVLCGLGAAVFCISGCGPRPPVNANSKSKLQAKLKDIGPVKLNSQGITVNWLERLPNGGVRRIMDIHAVSGELIRGSQSGLMNTADGVLYKDNVPKARFEAPTVHAYEDKKIVVAEGGVKAMSIQPVGITVTADKVTWYFARDLVVAEGNVYIQYQPVGTPKPVDWGGPVDRLTINTELKKFHIP
jgi:hypothetical protein